MRYIDAVRNEPDMLHSDAVSLSDKIIYRYEKSKLGLWRTERRLLHCGRSGHYDLELAACMVFKDEADYLNEWIRFHLAVGFDHIYLYDNDSRDDWRKAIPNELIADGKISITRISIENPQFVAYNHCLRRVRGIVKWLAILDADEFLYPTSDAGGSLKDVLKNFESHPAVAVNWLMFGTSGHVLQPKSSVVHDFRKCAPGGNKHVKIILQPELTVRVDNPHEAIYVDNESAVNENGHEVRGPFSEPPSLKRLRINHYWTKSVEEFLLKKTKRAEAMNTRRSALDLIRNEMECQSPSDDEALRFTSPSLKAHAFSCCG